MEGFDSVPDVQYYTYTLVETSSFCFHTLHNFNLWIVKQLKKGDFDVLERFPSPPIEYNFEYSELTNESAKLKVEKIRRNIVFAHMNAEESSALFRKFIEFCPENTSIKFSMVSLSVTVHISNKETSLSKLKFCRHQFSS